VHGGGIEEQREVCVLEGPPDNRLDEDHVPLRSERRRLHRKMRATGATMGPV